MSLLPSTHPDHIQPFSDRIFFKSLLCSRFVPIVVPISKIDSTVPADLLGISGEKPGILPVETFYICAIMATVMGNKIHHGRNVKRIREILGVKQEALALEMGDDWNQRKVSLLEQKEEIEEEILEEVAKGLKIPVEAIINFDEEAAVNVVSNTFTSNDSSTLNAVSHQCTFNPIDKVVELYERLLQSEKEKVALLEKLLAQKG